MMILQLSLSTLLVCGCFVSFVASFQVPSYSSSYKPTRSLLLVNYNDNYNPRSMPLSSSRDYVNLEILRSNDNDEIGDAHVEFHLGDAVPLKLQKIVSTLAMVAFACTGSTFILPTLPAMAAGADPVPSAFMAWAHFVGILGVSGGLVAERLLIRQGLSLDDEIRMNNADGIYGLSALSLLISGYFRVTSFAKGWDYYQNEPLFWIKMSSVAVLGALSFFPAIILFRRDLKRRELDAGEELEPLSDKIIDRMTTIINAELLALLTIPLFATLMARGVLYVNGFPWAIGVVLYLLCLGGAGFKYGKEAFDMMDEEGALSTVPTSDEK